MDKRRGFKRLILATSIPYLLFWTLWGWVGYDKYDYGQTHIMAEADAHNYVGMQFDSDASGRGLVMMKEAVTWGIVAPIFLLIGASLTYWVYRGFNSRSGGNE